MPTESVVLSDHLILCCILLLLPSVFPSIRVFSNELALCIRWPKYWSFTLSPSNDYSGLISFRIDWFDLFAIQRTLKSLLQHHNSKGSILVRRPYKPFFNHCTQASSCVGSQPEDRRWGNSTVKLQALGFPHWPPQTGPQHCLGRCVGPPKGEGAADQKGAGREPLS